MLLLGFDVLIIISTYFIYKELLKDNHSVEHIVLIETPPKYEDKDQSNPPDYD